MKVMTPSPGQISEDRRAAYPRLVRPPTQLVGQHAHRAVDAAEIIRTPMVASLSSAKVQATNDETLISRNRFRV